MIKNYPRVRLKDSHVKAREYALKLLSHCSRSEKEICDRLKKKGFDGNDITRTIKFLQETGLIKDEELVHELLINAVEKKYLGKRGIRLFLRNRGIKKDLIDEAISGLSEGAEKEAAMRLAQRKLKVLKNYPPDIIKRRLWGMLERRGFSAEIIKETLNFTDEFLS